ncbi:MAG: alpha/beta fold hydrolase [Clostridia bacterium]|nr:alpha/beta fold hydrolase [Clostridia bacterium]
MKTRPVPDFTLPEAQPFFLPGDDHGVLLIHGFTGSAAHMRMIGDHLHDRGFTVMGINLRGHATEMNDMLACSWETWLEDAVSALHQLQEKCGKVSVCGLSMGGDLSLILAAREKVTACVPISAPMAVKAKLMGIARPASKIVKQINWGMDDKRQAMLDSRYDQGYIGFPTRTAADLNRLIKLAKRSLPQITCPVLAIQSHGDETISASSAGTIVKGVSSPTANILWLDTVPHVCTISFEHERIGEAIGDFLRRAEG